MPEAGQATVADVVGASLVHLGVDHVFGVVGSGNFHVTNAMVAAGARFVASRHEAGAMTMADAFARTSGRVAAVTVHQGCGLTNTMTGLAEAAKSRTPVVVLAAEVAEPRSNFYVDQSALATAVGAVSRRLTSAASAADEVCDAVALALYERRTVLLNLPLHLQAEVAHPSTRRPTHRPVLPPNPTRACPTLMPWSNWSTRSSGPSGRCSSPAAAVVGRAVARHWSGWRPTRARCSPRRRWLAGCSATASGRWTSRAGSPRRPRPGSSPART